MISEISFKSPGDEISVVGMKRLLPTKKNRDSGINLILRSLRDTSGSAVSADIGTFGMTSQGKRDVNYALQLENL